MPALTPPTSPGQPAWQVAELFPPQGEWTTADYLALETNRLVELIDGSVEVLPLPTKLHQWIVNALENRLVALTSRSNVVSAPYRFHVRPGRYREADVLYAAAVDALGEALCEKADLVIEVVSEGLDQRHRDYVSKRDDYEAAGITEYWIVDPIDQTVTLFKRVEGRLVATAESVTTGVVRSGTVDGFAIEVPQIFTDFS